MTASGLSRCRQILTSVQVLDPKILDPKILDPKILDPRSWTQDLGPHDTGADDQLARRDKSAETGVRNSVMGWQVESTRLLQRTGTPLRRKTLLSCDLALLFAPSCSLVTGPRSRRSEA